MKWFHKLKHKTWFQLGAALCFAVLFYYILQHIPTLLRILKVVWNIALPLVAGLIIAYVIDPLVRLLERSIFRGIKSRKINRRLSVVISLIIVILGIGAILWVLIPELINSMQQLIGNLNAYMTNLEAWLKSLGGGFLKEPLEDIDFGNISKKLYEWLSAIAIGDNNIINISVSFGSGVVSVLMSVILSVYYLFDKDRLIRTLKRFAFFILKEKRYRPFADFCKNCNRILVRYICCSILEAIAVGVANAAVMLIFGLPYVPIISVVVGVTNLAPTFGPIAGGVIGGFLLLMIDPIYCLIFVITTIILQFLDGYVLKPRLFGETLGVSSVLILMSIVVCGRLFGVVGIIFAIPIAAIIQYLYRLANKSRLEKKLEEEMSQAEQKEAATEEQSKAEAKSEEQPQVENEAESGEQTETEAKSEEQPKEEAADEQSEAAAKSEEQLKAEAEAKAEEIKDAAREAIGADKPEK